MSPTLAVASAIASVLTTVLTVHFWDGPRRVRVARRMGGVTLSFILLALATLILVNRQVHFFLHWRDVVGGW